MTVFVLGIARYNQPYAEPFVLDTTGGSLPDARGAISWQLQAGGAAAGDFVACKRVGAAEFEQLDNGLRHIAHQGAYTDAAWGAFVQGWES